MFEYKKIKVELENMQCPVHGKSAIVSFKEGRMILESVCCDEHKKYLLENVSEVALQEEADILLQSLTGI